MQDERHGKTGARRVLVVEDDEDCAAVLKLLLAAQGHQVRTASDAAAALDLCAAEPPEVVLSDLGLAGMSGYDLARELRGRHARGELLLVALTGWDGNGITERCREAGFDGHLTKPIQDFATLLSLVADLEIPDSSRLF